MQATAIAADDGHEPPVLRIHSIEKPFCEKPECWCKSNQRVVTSLLLRINNNLLILNKAQEFKEES